MAVEEFRQLTLVQSVLSRPRMYTVNGTLPELLAFFNGCLDAGDGEKRDDGSVQLFFDWLGGLIGFDSRLILPSRIYDSAIKHFGTEDEAVSSFRAEFLDLDGQW